MLFKGYIVDDDTDMPVSGASVYQLNTDGTRKKILAQANDSGEYEFESLSAGTKIEFDFPGYEPTVIEQGMIPGSGRVSLIPGKGSTGENVVLSSKKRVSKPDYTLPIVIGISAIVAFGVYLAIK